MRAAGTLAIALVLAGSSCGGDESSPSDESAPPTGSAPSTSTEVTGTVPTDEYVAAADKLCAQAVRGAAGYLERVQKIQAAGGSDEEQLRRALPALRDQLKLVTGFRTKVEALGLPDEHADDAALLVEKTRVAEDKLAQAVEAVEAGRLEGVNDLFISYAGLSSQSASIARDSELGFTVCGAGA